MKKEEFIDKLKDSLEIDIHVEISRQTDLTQLEEFNSLGVLSVNAMIDENFGKMLPVTDFQEITTVKSLMEKIGTEYFE